MLLLFCWLPTHFRYLVRRLGQKELCGAHARESRRPRWLSSLWKCARKGQSQSVLMFFEMIALILSVFIGHSLTI
jgi:hypothetical protein